MDIINEDKGRMKILILSYEVWRTDNSGGNVLSNLFQNMDAEFAQVYCSPGIPMNGICRKYFQMTDFMMIKNILGKGNVGNQFELKEDPKETQVDNKPSKFYSFFKKFHWTIFDFARELIWKLADSNNKQLDHFVRDFKPDIVFAPCYANLFMLRLSRHVAKQQKCQLISYISDDHYTFRHWNYSPFFWLNRLFLRSALKKTFPYYSLVYTMTEEQKEELSTALNANMKILRKGIDFKGEYSKKVINDPIRIIFAGGVYCGRWKTLGDIGKILRTINKDRVKIRLDIYTPTQCSKKIQELLNDGESIFLHKSIAQSELKDVYMASDIALHVESFDRSYRLLTRLSFSTKIVDCLGSGCAVMAISWKGHSGLKYLQKENAAFCVDHPEDIAKVLNEIVDQPYLIDEYAKKAYVCGKNNHQGNVIQDNLYRDFKELVSNTQTHV